MLFDTSMPLDEEKFRTESSAAGFLYLAFLAGGSDRAAAAHPAANGRHPPSMHDNPASRSAAPRIRADGLRRLEIRRVRRRMPSPAGVIAAEK